MDIVALQVRKALTSLPWYTGIPFVICGSTFLFIYLVAGGDGKAYWNLSLYAAGVGGFVWTIRQSVRLLWTIRIMTRY